MSTLKRVRQKRGFTQRRFAQMLGIRHETLCRVEAGQQAVSPTVLRLAAFLLATPERALRAGLKISP